MFLNNKIYLAILGFLCCQMVFAQAPTIQILEQGRKTSIRGMSVVNNDVVWVSGSGGAVGKSVDGGKTWQWITVAGYEKSDFRDIEAFDENTALIMGITQPAVILKTKDGGNTWKKVFEDTAKAAFFDAMAFEISANDTIGVLIGDPINGDNYVAYTANGDSWLLISTPKNKNKRPSYINGEAFFASSGTNILFVNSIGDFDPLFLAVSGGLESSLIEFTFGGKTSIPMIKGKNSTGANSIAIYSKTRRGMIVGGDFANDTISTGNATMFSFDKKNGSVKFDQPTTPPHGYRSCVIYIDEKKMITCGTSGVDISTDGGMNWELISKESFHVVQKAKKGNAVFLAGKGGRIARFN